MVKFLLFIYLLAVPAALLAQGRGDIKGKVLDSVKHEPVELATVAVLHAKDTTTSALIDYAQTDKEGLFNIKGLPAGVPLKAVISFVGYRPYVKFFSLVKNQTLNMANVLMSPRQLNEVTVRAERMPIVVRKDTIEFDATAFKVKPNAVVEDLLKKLPGVEVDRDGKISVMGKNVTKVLVDGHEFFPSDQRIATRNLDADMIAKVQVYDDRENDPDHLIPESRVDKIIDLKFKRALRKSIFGKVYGGDGAQHHYQTGGLFNLFRDTLQISLLGLHNNLNNTGFDFNDLYTNGGINRGGSALLQGGIGQSAFGGLGVRGKQTTTSAGANINTDYGKKLKVNLGYVFTHTKNVYNSMTARQQFLADTATVTNAVSSNTNYTDSHIITATLSSRSADNSKQLTYNPGVTINNSNSLSAGSSNSYTNFINPLNNSGNNGTTDNRYFTFNQSLTYYRQLKKKGASISLNHSLNYNPAAGTNIDDQNFVSYVANPPSYFFRQEAHTVNRNFSENTGLVYHNPLTKQLSLDINATQQFGSSINKTSTFNYNPATGIYDSFLIDKSNDLLRRNWTETLNSSFRLNLPKGPSFSARLSPQWQQVTNVFNRGLPNLYRNYFYLLPSAGADYKNFSLSYDNSVQLPNIGDLIPYTVVFSPQYSVVGNPDLKPTVRSSYNLGYRKFNYQSGSNISIGFSASFEHNGIFRKRTQTAQLVETSTPINRDGRHTYSANLFYNKQLKKKKDLTLSLSTNINLSTNHDFFVLNQQDGFQNNFRLSGSERISFNYKDVIDIDPEYSLNEVYTTYSGVSYNAQKNLTQGIETRFIFTLPKSFNIDGTYAFHYNPQVPPGFQQSSNLLNVALAHQFLAKNAAEIKLTCYDILDQSISTTRYVSYNSINDEQSEVVRRYFMLTLLYKFNKANYKDEPRKGLILK